MSAAAALHCRSRIARNWRFDGTEQQQRAWTIVSLSGRRVAARLARNAWRVVAIMSVSLACLIVSGAPGYADQGDGLLSCNVGEICFKQHNGGANENLRHYWFSDDDTNAHFDDFFSHTGTRLRDNASSYYNRDTECGVYIADEFPSGVRFNLFLMPAQMTGGYLYLGNSANDKNNAHRRCTGW